MDNDRQDSSGVQFPSADHIAMPADWDKVGLGGQMKPLTCEIECYVVSILLYDLDELLYDLHVSGIRINARRLALRYAGRSENIQRRQISTVHCTQEDSEIVRKFSAKDVFIVSDLLVWEPWHPAGTALKLKPVDVWVYG